MTTWQASPGGFTETEWGTARSWGDYLASVTDKRDIWETSGRRFSLDEDARARLENLPGPRSVLVLTEDWCGDAARSVPALAAALEAAPAVEHRCLDSDAHPSVPDRCLTHGGRSIPIALVQDEEGRLLGIWGPRPAPLQALARARVRRLGRPRPEEMGSFCAPVLAW